MGIKKAQLIVSINRALRSRIHPTDVSHCKYGNNIWDCKREVLKNIILLEFLYYFCKVTPLIRLFGCFDKWYKR